MGKFNHPLLGVFFALALLLSTCFVFGTPAEDEEDVHNREGKIFSAFQIVTFPNDVCVGGSKNGSCFTSTECTDKGGTSDGTCASGYGVCCVFSLTTTGASSSENITYLSNPTNVAAGTIKNTVCPCSSNICQMRLDFNTFVIAGPSTLTLTDTKILNGQAAAGGVDASSASQCSTDQFMVTGTGGINPPVICGTNSGQHMYVDATNTCIDYTFNLGSTAVGTTIPTRMWDVSVTQIPCDSPLRAPDGCTQYYYGSSTGTVQTFNYANGQHLANQQQTICVRRETGQCKICWTAAAVTDFMVSGPADPTKSVPLLLTLGESCCSYGTDGMASMGYDCLSIPGATKSGKTTLPSPSHICGRSMGIASSTVNNMPTSVCSQRTPFYIRFNSDNYEFADEVMAKDKGFMLNYEQSGGC